MEFLLPVVAVAVLLAGGAGLTCLLLPRSRRSSVVEIVSLAILFGAGLISFASFVVGLSVPAAVFRLVVTTLAVGLAGAGLLALRRRPIHLSGVPRLSAWTLVGLTIVGCQLAVVAVIAWHDWLDFDGLFMWETKAHLACTNGGSIPLAYFSDPSRLYSHQDYPLFVPLTENWIYALSGSCGQDLARIIFPLFYAAAAGLLGTSVARFTRSTSTGLLGASLLFLVPKLVFGSGSATSGYADFVLGTVYLACACYFVEYLRLQGRSRAILPLSFALLSLLPWIKQEGAILFLCLAAAFFGHAVLTHRYRLRVLGGVALAGVPFVVWRVFLAWVGAPSGQDFIPLTFSDFFANYARTAEAGAWTAGELVHLASWSILWPLFALSLGLPRAGYAWRERLGIALLVGLPLALEIHLYIFSNYGGVTLHVASSMPRLILQLAPTAVLGIALCAPRFGVARQPATTVRDVVESLGLTNGFVAVGTAPADDQVKTVVVVGRSNPPTYAMCVLLSTTLLDMNGTVRQRLGTRRASIASSVDTLLGAPSGWPIWVDSRVMAHTQIVLSDGSDSQHVVTAPTTLCRLPEVEVVSGLAREPAP